MTCCNATDVYRRVEHRACLRVVAILLGAELYRMMILLTPLYEATLEVGLGLQHLVDREIMTIDVVDKQTIGKVITLVEVYSTHHSLKGIAEDMLLCGITRSIGDDKFIQAQCRGDAVEGLS